MQKQPLIFTRFTLFWWTRNWKWWSIHLFNGLISWKFCTISENGWVAAPFCSHFLLSLYPIPSQISIIMFVRLLEILFLMSHSFGHQNLFISQDIPIKVLICLSHRLTNSSIKVIGGKDYPVRVKEKQRPMQMGTIQGREKLI